MNPVAADIRTRAWQNQWRRTLNFRDLQQKGDASAEKRRIPSVIHRQYCRGKQSEEVNTPSTGSFQRQWSHQLKVGPPSKTMMHLLDKMFQNYRYVAKIWLWQLTAVGQTINTLHFNLCIHSESSSPAMLLHIASRFHRMVRYSTEGTYMENNLKKRKSKVWSLQLLWSNMGNTTNVFHDHHVDKAAKANISQAVGLYRCYSDSQME